MKIDAQTALDQIYNYLDKYSLKTSTATQADLISFVEEQWAVADETKYQIASAKIIMSRMVNEYIRLSDYDNMKVWLDQMDKHSSASDNPTYIRHYYKGECCLSCGNEEMALHYLNLCYKEQPDYIFTRAPFCYTFFNQHLDEPVVLPEPEESDELEIEGTVHLEKWSSFFQTNKPIRYQVLLDEMEEQATVEQLTDLAEQVLLSIQAQQPQLLTRLLDALFQEYRQWQPMYGYQGEDKEAFMPDVHTHQDFARLLTPMVIYILPTSMQETLAVGFLFDCSWDNEHGLGFLTKEGQVIDLGGANVAFGM